MLLLLVLWILTHSTWTAPMLLSNICSHQSNVFNYFSNTSIKLEKESFWNEVVWAFHCYHQTKQLWHRLGEKNLIWDKKELIWVCLTKEKQLVDLHGTQKITILSSYKITSICSISLCLQKNIDSTSCSASGILNLGMRMFSIILFYIWDWAILGLFCLNYFILCKLLG